MQLNGKIIVLCMVLRLTHSTTANMPNEVAPDDFTMNDFVLTLPIEMGLLYYCIHFREWECETQNNVLKVMHENRNRQKWSFLSNFQKVINLDAFEKSHKHLIFKLSCLNAFTICPLSL